MRDITGLAKAALTLTVHKGNAVCMSKELHEYMQRLCDHNKVVVPKKQAELFKQFATDERRAQAYQQIVNTQQSILKDWEETSGIADIMEKPVQIPNARVGKPYTFTFDAEALGIPGIAYFELANLDATGLSYDSETATLSGIPTAAGEYRLHFRFRHKLSADDAELSQKELPLIINADPKSLWKDEPSNRNDAYWKEDSDKMQKPMTDKMLAIASKRGRSHAHEGKFRDDDFKAAQLAGDWGIIALADGAGSAKFSRRGSLIACESVVSHFSEGLTPEQWAALEDAILANAAESTGDTQKALSQQVLEHMVKAAMGAHNAIAKEATASEAKLKDYSTTLMFALLKKFPFGYFITSFWVGDGGIGIYSKERNEVQILGAPDGGEFAGQTRFLTMPEVFKSADFYNRFSIKTVPDFTALVLMTDGITDPKFSTDANLGRIEKWNELWEDLSGKNEDGAAVSLDAENEQVADELLSWLDFWSPGNHDDRTIAILF